MDPLPFNLQRHLIGGGRVERQPDGVLRLTAPATPHGYADAQIDDTVGLARGNLRWSAPLSLSLRARASEPNPRGTLGFGFWNDPFGFSLGGAGGTRRLPAAPQALWFFYGSQPNELSFVRGGQGSGWKAAVLRSPRMPALILAPGAAGAFLMGALPGLRKLAVRSIRRFVSAAESTLDAALDSWHSYQLHWDPEAVRFVVDGELVLRTEISPTIPLGFVAWIDNQYAVLSEDRGIRFGVLPTEREAWLEIAELQLEGGQRMMPDP